MPAESSAAIAPSQTAHTVEPDPVALNRFFPTTCVFNFRDVGGLPTGGGGYIRKGVLLRSDNWMHSTKEDQDYAHNQAKIRRIIDLRRPREIEDMGLFPATPMQTVHRLHMRHIPWEQFFDTSAEPQTDRERMVFLSQRYASMMESGYESVRDSLNVISQGETTLVHCVAGKDRTGIVIAVALALVGVPEEEIAADYELTNVGSDRWRTFREKRFGPAVKESGLRCHRDIIPMTFDLIRERFHSIENYAHVIGFHRRQELREALLD